MESNASAARTASTHSLNRAASSSGGGIVRQASIASLSSAAAGAQAATGFPFGARTSTPGMSPITPSTPHGHAHAHAQNQALPREARKVNIDSGLDSYYPFDPFDLPRTGQVIEPMYWTYGDVAVDASDDEDDDSSDSDGETDSDDDEDDEAKDEDERLGASAASAGKGKGKLRIPHPNSFGSKVHGTSLDRRRALRDGAQGGVLSTSFEGMSISPARAGLIGRA